MHHETSHSALRKARVNEIEIAYDTFGDPQGQPMLLSTGWRGQLISWDEEFCKQLAERGYWLIRYDYRDVGLSTKLDELGVPDIEHLARSVFLVMALWLFDDLQHSF